MLQKTPNTKTLSVKDFFDEHCQKLQLTECTKSGGMYRTIRAGEIHRPGLALAGFVRRFAFKRVQILGNTETAYLCQLDVHALEETVCKVFKFNIPCLIFTHNNQPPQRLIEIADECKICVFTSPLPTTEATQLINVALETIFAPRNYVHGTLVDVYGMGILITGKSGIGKTEVALDLVKRGHRLVADDVVTVLKRAGDILIGHGNELLQHCMEIRGVGILDIQSVFGIRGIRMQKRVETVVELEIWDADKNYERLGLDDKHYNILGIDLPLIQLAIFPGKSIAVIIEVIALNQMLRYYGLHTAKAFEERLDRKMESGSSIEDSPCLEPDCE
ncbi:HPr(Ser) kinase/phosphatase [bacterium]|nr:HPr(Ser) kinase/phosphatase [bacterium]